MACFCRIEKTQTKSMSSNLEKFNGGGFLSFGGLRLEGFLLLASIMFVDVCCGGCNHRDRSRVSRFLANGHELESPMTRDAEIITDSWHCH